MNEKQRSFIVVLILAFIMVVVWLVCEEIRFHTVSNLLRS
jgi:hypothetical protein